MKPSQESIAAFNAFASVHGLNTTAAGGHGEWMSFTTNVSHANSLFAASFQQFQHESAAAPIARTLSYSLPLAIADHVDTVYPTTTFGRPIAPRQGPSVIGSLTKRQQATNFNITPSSLQKLYNIPASAKDPAGISILITGYANEIPQAADTAVSTDDVLLYIALMDRVFQAFITQFRPDLDPNTPVNVIPLDGGLNTQSLPNAKYGLSNRYILVLTVVQGW
jgi:tripeptidyl-peptidase-1